MDAAQHYVQYYYNVIVVYTVILSINCVLAVYILYV